MPQVVEYPPLPSPALSALIRVCKETPAKGEPFREFRSRLRGFKLWDKERPQTLLRFLGIGGTTIVPSPMMQALAAASGEEQIGDVILDRLWHMNPLLLKTVLDLVQQRAYHRDEIYKQLGTSAYKGALPSRPIFEVWLNLALSAGLIRTIGVAVMLGPKSDKFIHFGQGFDADEFLADDKPDPEPVIPSASDEEAAAAVVAGEAGPESSIPVSASAPAGSPLPAPLRHLSADGIPTPRNRERPVPTSRFASGFSDEVLEETQKRIAAWRAEVDKPALNYQPSDFGLDPEGWVEGADEIVYRVAVAAALAFRLDRDRRGVIAAFNALDKTGVLGDLYQGIVPENLPAHVDARALMLASLAARRCSEVPELASQLDGRASAAEAFASLDTALGRGLFRTELFWIMDMLAKLGVVRYDDLGDFTVTPHRIVRDTLFRLGFIATPYANDGASLTAAARAARKAVPEGAADETLTLFALAAGCAYDCAHRKTCDYPCRERLE